MFCEIMRSTTQTKQTRRRRGLICYDVLCCWYTVDGTKTTEARQNSLSLVSLRWWLPALLQIVAQNFCEADKKLSDGTRIVDKSTSSLSYKTKLLQYQSISQSIYVLVFTLMKNLRVQCPKGN